MVELLQVAKEVWVNPVQIAVIWKCNLSGRMSFTTSDGKTYFVDEKYEKGFFRCVRLVSQRS